MFRQAHALTKGENLRSWLEKTVFDRFPDSELAPNIEREPWHQANPRPGRDTKPEERKAYSERERAAGAEWRKHWPNSMALLWDDWFHLISAAGNELPLEQKLAIADRFMKARRDSPDYGSANPPFEVGLAGWYVKWNTRLDQVPGLLDRGLFQSEMEAKYRINPDQLPPEMRDRMIEDPVRFTRLRVNLIRADYYLARKDAAGAAEAIDHGLAEVDAVEPAAPTPEAARRMAESRRREWRARQGRLAELEGDIPRALSYYQQVVAAYPTQSLSGEWPSEEVAAIKKFYLAHGGKEESFLEWAAAGRKDPAPAPAGPPPLAYLRPLGDFSVKDLGGRTWSLADFKGKATFVDIWATWCGPCRAEHPELQKLHDKVKDRRDMQVVTFSVDEHSYLAESYVKENRYTFPVLFDTEITERLFPAFGLPSGYIVDAQGRRSRMLRFSTVERVFAELEKAAAAK